MEGNRNSESFDALLGFVESFDHLGRLVFPW